MKITKAVITAASRNQRSLPLQMLIDRDGEQKSVLAILLNEARQAEIEDCCVVVCPGDEETYRAAAGASADRLRFVAQQEPRGYGHAVNCARGFVRDEPFLHLVGDHIYISDSGAAPVLQRASAEPDRTGSAPAGVSCAAQLVAAAEANDCAVSGVQPTRETLLPLFGAVGGQRVKGTQDVFAIDQVIEKPTPTQAEQTLLVPGLRTGHYLCFFGMHILNSARHGAFGAAVVGIPRTRRAFASAERNGAAREVPRSGGPWPPVSARRAIRPAHRADRAGPQRPGPRGGSRRSLRASRPAPKSGAAR